MLFWQGGRGAGMSSKAHRRTARHGALLGVLGAVVLIGLGSSCAAPASSQPGATPAVSVKAGSWYVIEPWPHDGHPYETSNFVVFSDAASDQAKREAGDMAERLWAELLSEFSVQREMLHYPAGRDAIDLYLYQDYYVPDWGGRAYYGGLFMWSPDHERRSSDPGDYAAVMQHELVHVIQFLIMGRQSLPFDVWFTEGLAEAAVGGTSAGAIRGLDRLNALTAEYGTVNPISIKGYSQITSPDAGFRFYYPMFELANEYLLADGGLGRSAADARDVLIDVADGVSFASAFETHMGISLADYQDEFFSRMDSYLPRYRSVVFTPVGFGVLSAVVVVFVCGALAVGLRRWRLTTGSIELTGRGRVARFGFYGALSVASGLLILLFLRGLMTIGTLDALNNASNAADRLRAYSLLIGYLLASVAVLLWAIRRWSHGSRLAFLGPLLVVVATFATLVAIGSML
jgi:hypothetical protein